MRVAFDPQTFLRQRTGGISRMFTDLIDGFDRRPELGVDPRPLFRWVNNEYAAADLRGHGVRCTPQRLPRELLYAPWAVRGLPRVHDVDLVHHTYYSRRFLRPIGSALRVTTVHDMIPEKFAGTPWFTASHLAKRDYVLSSDLVVCVSESTRDDMEAHYGTVRGRVVVVHNAVRSTFSPTAPRPAGLPPEYLLYVGSRKGYKDFPVLPRAVRALMAEGSAVPVVVVGAPFTAIERTNLERLGVDRLFVQVGLRDDELAGAYANALATVQTSRYEGFGMTPLEALSSGSPVVVAGTSSMPEVCGALARYFEPGDADGLAAAIGAALADDGARRGLATAGPQWAARFSTARMVERTAEAYRSVIAG